MQTPLQELLALGIKEKASDWHIREGKNVYIRCNGKLLEIENSLTSKEFLEDLIKKICNEKDLIHLEETGDADFALEEDGIGRFRVNLHRQSSRLALVLRHIKSKVPNIAEMHLPPILKDISEANHGIILITGATGSGKSTSMAAMIDNMNKTQNRHIVTIEDPIEFVYEDKNCIIQQREVGLDVCSFDSALVHVLRQDPDVIVIGEIRNRDTFDTALKAAQTGHLVIGTLHTQSVVATVLRILDLYQTEEHIGVLHSFAQAMRAIICQRLLPTPDGRGRLPVCEIIRNAPVVEKLIAENKLTKLPSAIEANEQMGMQTFNKHLLELVYDGLITEEAALQNSDHPEALKMNLRGVFLSSDGGLVS